MTSPRAWAMARFRAGGLPFDGPPERHRTFDISTFAPSKTEGSLVDPPKRGEHEIEQNRPKPCGAENLPTAGSRALVAGHAMSMSSCFHRIWGRGGLEWLRYHNIRKMVCIPLMAAVVAMDRAGRIVIPKDVREAQGIIPGTKFRLVEGKDGILWRQRWDPEELGRRIHDELRSAKL